MTNIQQLYGENSECTVSEEAWCIMSVGCEPVLRGVRRRTRVERTVKVRPFVSVNRHRNREIEEETEK